MYLDTRELAKMSSWHSMILEDHEYDRMTLDGDIFYMRNGKEWTPTLARPRINTMLIPDVYFWLTENIGPEYSVFWEVDRPFFGHEFIPEIDLPRDEWCKRYSFNRTETRLWCWTVNGSSIGFKNKDQAMLFKLTWGGK